MLRKKFVRTAIVTAILLAIPLITGMNWNLFDFIVAGLLFLGTGFSYEIISKKGGTVAYKTAAGVAIFSALFLIWINLAVGLIGNENNPVNLLYFGVVGVEIAGMLLSRFGARGMSRAMFVTAAVQFIVPIVALIVNKPSVNTTEELIGVAGVFVLNTFFVLLFAASGMLFKRSQVLTRATVSSPE